MCTFKRIVTNSLVCLLVFSHFFAGGNSVHAGEEYEKNGLSEIKTELRFEGRVYAGSIDDQSSPLEGITVSLYASNNPEPASFIFIDSTRTDSTGWYGLYIPEAWEYYRIIETDPEGYSSAGATTVSGTVISANIIEYTIPLEGKTLTGNKFWDEENSWTFSGRVYEGDVGDEGTPLSGVEVSLYVGNDSYPSLGDLIDTSSTNESGWYGLTAPEGYEYYQIVESDPSAYVSAGATSVSGSVLTANLIEYVVPIDGKTLTGNKFWDEPVTTPTPPPPGANLVVNDFWPDGSQVCFQIENIGSEGTGSGFTAALLVDSSPFDTETYGSALGSGGIWNGCFDAPLSCSGAEDILSVTADSLGEVSESDETDNAREETWPCDQTAPEFVTLPYIDDLTTSSVDVHWETNEETEGIIYYGTLGDRYPSEWLVDTFSLMKDITVSGLTPNTGYHLKVKVMDGAGNETESQSIVFETPPESDTQDPVVSMMVAEVLSDEVVLLAEATDNIEVERVEFYLDDVIFFTDYSPPYEAKLDTRLYANGEHLVYALAFDTSNRMGEAVRTTDFANPVDAAAPQVTITKPTQSEVVSGTVNVTANLSDDTGLSSAQFFIDGIYTGFEGFSTYPLSTTVSFQWDTSGLTKGSSYRLGIQVYDKDFKSTIETVDVVIGEVPAPPPSDPPNLIITNHTVTRFQNAFTIAITVKNDGDINASNVCIKDGLKGFQAIESIDTAINILTYWDPKSNWGYADICYNLDIPAGQQRIFTYNAAPVLVYPNPPTPTVGWFIDMAWESPTGTNYYKYLNLPVSKTTANNSIPVAHALAVKNSNYLIVTAPYRLAAFHAPAYFTSESFQAKTDFNHLLSTMAELARHKNGVIAYLNSGNAGTLRSLVSPGGDWMWRMSPDFWTIGSGYLLIVGETNIISSYDWTNWNREWSDGTVTNDVDYSDSPIANTSGDKRPELIIGRIIGDSLSALTLPIRTSIQVYNGETGHSYDSSHALSVSGTGNGLDKMIDGANDTETLLDSRGYSCDVMHWSDYIQANQEQEFLNRAPGRDIIYLFAHGNVSSLGPLDSNSLSYGDFGTTHPFIMGASCLTGDYVNGDFAESMLDAGAGVYIASTELSPMSVNKVCGDYLYTSTITSNTAGQQFQALKRKFWTMNTWYRFWAAEYNYYGEPKYGSTPTNPKSELPIIADEAPTVLNVNLPMYALSELDGKDVVEIPGGHIWLEQGEYQIPFYSVTLSLPSGTVLQTIALTGKSNLSSDTGLVLPVSQMEITQIKPALNKASVEGELPWFAEQDYSWEVVKNPDGTSTVYLMIYPLVYNPETTNLTYAQDFSFELSYIDSSVSIEQMTLNQMDYALGELVSITTSIMNSGAEQYVGVEAFVKDSSSGEIVDGLPIAVLNALKGDAEVDLVWDSSGFAEGDYEIELKLISGSGDILDRQTESFKLGKAEVSISAFSSGKTYFEPGDPIYLSLDFQNLGDVNASGTAYLQIFDPEGNLVAAFDHDYAGLAPDTSISFNDLWDSVGAARGRYSLVAYVIFNSQATEVFSLDMQTDRYLYLPLISNQ